MHRHFELAALFVSYLLGACALSAACAAWLSKFPQAHARQLASRTFPAMLTALHLWIVVHAIDSERSLEALDLAFVLALSALVLHAAATEWLFWRARRGLALLEWAPWGHLLVGVAALGLALGTAWRLHSQSLAQIEQWRARAVESAARIAPPCAAPEDNAASSYYRASHELFGGDEPIDLHQLEGRLRSAPSANEALSVLTDNLGGAAERLDEVVVASELGCCDFDPSPRDFEGIFGSPALAGLLGVGRLLAIRARTRAAAGDVEAAARDLRAALDVFEHISRAPTPSALIFGAAGRELVLEECARLLASEQLSSEALDSLESAREFPCVARLADAVELEQAGLHALLHEAVVGRPGERAPWWEDIGSTLRAALQDVVSLPGELEYTARGFDAVRTLAGFDPRDAVRMKRFHDEVLVPSLQGEMASMMIGDIRPLVTAAHRSDARDELYQLACRAARERLATGVYPQHMPDVPASVVWTVDAQRLELRRSDWGFGENAVRFTLPPESRNER
jgi:hypothetical protein